MSSVEKMREDKKMKRQTGNEEAGKNDTSEIEKLTDDCLIEIFQHLTTIADKIRIEGVCKRWQQASKMAWNNFKSLDFSAKTWGMEEYRHDQRLIKSVDFDKIIRLSGRYLTSVSTDVGKFAKICHLLPKILKLQLIDFCLDENNKCLTKYSKVRNIEETTSQCTYGTWQEVLSWLLSHGDKITHFKMEVYHSHYKQEDFASLLRNMKQLKSLSLYNCNYLDWSGTFLLELRFDIIREIILSSADILPFDIYLLSTILQKCKKLQTLDIHFERCEDPGILEFLPLQAESLKNYKLKLDYRWSWQWKSVLLSTISVLTQLEKLDVSDCFSLNDEFLEVVAKSCKKLTYLNLHNCSKVTDRGISSICNLEKLTYLSIHHLPEIKNPPLEKLTSLVVLTSCWNKNLQEECLCSFLKKAYQLRALNVRRIHSVSNKLLDVAIEVARIRKSNNALDLYVNENEIDMGVLCGKPPFLNIIDSFDVPVAKYGIEDPFNIETPERIEIATIQSLVYVFFKKLSSGDMKQREWLLYSKSLGSVIYNLLGTCSSSVSVIKFLGARGLAFRESDKKLNPEHNGNFLGLIVYLL